MSGNVSEWCQDKWIETYRVFPEDGSAREYGSSVLRIHRGGSGIVFRNFDANSITVTNRHAAAKRMAGTSYHIGFRVVREL